MYVLLKFSIFFLSFLLCITSAYVNFGNSKEVFSSSESPTSASSSSTTALGVVEVIFTFTQFPNSSFSKPGSQGLGVLEIVGDNSEEISSLLSTDVSGMYNSHICFPILYNLF